jgi:hypothetical protein
VPHNTSLLSQYLQPSRTETEEEEELQFNTTAAALSELREALVAEVVVSVCCEADMATAAAPKSHAACRNASNPYHECSEYCFRVIAAGGGGGAADGAFSFLTR